MLDKIIGEAKGIFNIITLFEIIISIIFILIGLLFFTSSTASNVLVSIVTGFALIVAGASSIFSYFRRGSIVLFNNYLIMGILYIIIGVISMFLKQSLSIALGIYLLVVGCQKISYGLFLKKFNEKTWIFDLVVGILFIALGVTAFFTNGEYVIEVVGICLLGYGLINLINIILLRKRSKYFIA